ncbi:MAG: J domain-containing protein [Gammaproteobacteria bacterium]|nr:J domain-containing protein [Gammaproteobacteria bacterium]
MSTSRNYYDVLGVSAFATPEVIKAAYHKKILMLHPDKHPVAISEDSTLFQEVQIAYETLSDVVKRSDYDLSHLTGSSTPDYEVSSSVDPDELDITQNEYYFLHSIAEDIGLDLSYITECYKKDDGRYDRLSGLRVYLENFKTKSNPALSINEALNTTDQEMTNLITCTILIEERYLSMDQAKALSETERLAIATIPIEGHYIKRWCEAAMQKLKALNVPNTAQQSEMPTTQLTQTHTIFFKAQPTRKPKVVIKDSFIGDLARYTGLNENYLQQCYNQDSDVFSKISLLKSYLHNFHKKQSLPALSLEEVSKLTDQQVTNLYTAYDLVKHSLLSLKEAKDLTSGEQHCLAITSIYPNQLSWANEAYENLLNFRNESQLNFNRGRF